MADGVVIVDKPAGWTSHDVVGRLRRIAGTRKVGHAGTLDPMATGVLVLGIGRATRLLGHLMLGTKVYTATVRFGVTTTTDDADGEVVDRHDASALTAADVDRAAEPFRGDIDQVPSKVSAVKVGGRRAYELAREGTDVQLAARSVHIERLEVGATRTSGAALDVDIEVECSSGTYIRALARDIGAGLRVGGHLTALRRTRVGPFGLSDSRSLEELAQQFEPLTIGTAAGLSFPVQALDAETEAKVRHGRPISDITLPDGDIVALFDPAGEFLALYRQSGRSARAVAVFC